MIIRLFVIVVIIFAFSLLHKKDVKASVSNTDDINFSDIQTVIDDILSGNNSINFQSYVERLMNGEETFSPTEIGTQLLHTVKEEIKHNMNVFGRLISIALLAAIFTNLSMAFKNNHVSETGYYVTYLLMFAMLIGSFVTASRIAASALESVLLFMKALVPAYFISVGFCTGVGTSFVFYQAALIMITAVDVILIKIVIPLINFYLVIMLANNLSKEDMLSRLAGLIVTAINWILKSLLATVIGFHAIQGLILPVADRVKRSAILKVSEAIPGIGNAIGSVTETVLGAGVLLKNAIGVAGLVVVIVICAVPLLKLLVITAVYKCGSAALQPVSDKRIIECIGATSKSAGLLLHTVFIGAVLFLLSITIVAVTTGGLM